MARIEIPTVISQPLSRHLERPGEQLAFMAARQVDGSLVATDLLLIGDELLDAQDRWHVSLGEDGRSAVIRWGHSTGASLVEVHSHPGPLAAAMSRIDLDGLTEWVPHVMWRLGGRPYAAIVVTPRTVDALVWDQAGVWRPDSILWGAISHVPTGISLEMARR